MRQQLQRRAASLGLVQDVLLQVNVGDEAQKGGAAVDALLPLLESVAQLPNLCVRGLMCVPPALPPEQARAYFASLRELLFTAHQPVSRIAAYGIVHGHDTRF